MEKEQLGMRIRRFRELAEMSREELAERTGLALEFVQSLEEDSVYPSLGPLLKVARALGIRLGTFLDDELGHDPLLVRLEERKEELSMLRGKDRMVDMRFYSLGRGKKDRHMEPFYVELLPESAAEKRLSSHEGEEFIVVQKGKVEITYGQETLLLEEGDSLYLNSVVPHHVGCSGVDTAAIYAVLYFPE